MKQSISPPRLRAVRLPGEFGPILRCSGELSSATAEALRRELALVAPLDHPALILNLYGCRSVDVEGIKPILDAFEERRQRGRHLSLVAHREPVGRFLELIGLTQIVPVFPTEEEAVTALRSGAPSEPGPSTWEAARAETVARWRVIQELLDQAPHEHLLSQMTAMTALCERAEALRLAGTPPAATRCAICPLFFALGGRPADVGCRSVLDPLLDAVRAGDRDAARAQVAELLRTLEEMPLEPRTGTPIPWLPSAIGITEERS